MSKRFENSHTCRSLGDIVCYQRAIKHQIYAAIVHLERDVDVHAAVDLCTVLLNVVNHARDELSESLEKRIPEKDVPLADLPPEDPWPFEGDV